MQKDNYMNLNSVSFGKKYISETSVRNFSTGKKEPCRFFQYEKNMKDALELSSTLKSWQKEKGASSYIKYLEMHTDSSFSEPSVFVYGLETKNGEVLAIADAYQDSDTNEQNQLDICYTVAKPNCVYGSAKRKYSRAGIALFQQIVNAAKNKNLKKICLMSGNHGFWSKIPALKMTSEINFELDSKDYDKCIKELDEII